MELGRPQMRIWRMPIECWISKTINTHSECKILIACPLQQWLHKRTPMLRYIQGVTGGTDQTLGECSLGQTIPI